MIVEDRQDLGAAALAEAKAIMRVDGAGEDGVVSGMVAAAAAVCEAFVGRMLVERGVTETVAAGGAWTRLGRTPVLAVTGVSDAAGVAVSADAYAVDIDANGDGWVRATGSRGARAVDAASGGARLRVSYQAGLAADWTGVPDPLRQGVLRLAAHLYVHRDDGAATGDKSSSPPAAVAALWRPFRRMRLR